MKYKIVYGIRDDFDYPCFARLVYQNADKFYLQVEGKTDIRFEKIKLDSKEELIGIEYNSDKILDFRQPIYCVMLRADKIFIGSKRQLHDKLYDEIMEYPLFFRERFNRLVDNPWQLLIIYKEMQCFKYSKSTRTYAKVQYRDVIKEIVDALEKLTLIKKGRCDVSILEKKSPLDIMEYFYSFVSRSFGRVSSKNASDASKIILSPYSNNLRVKIPIMQMRRIKQKVKNDKTLQKNKYVDSILQYIE